MSISALGEPPVSTAAAATSTGRSNSGKESFQLPDTAEPANSRQSGGFKLSGAFQSVSALPVDMVPELREMDFQAMTDYLDAETNYMMQVMDFVKAKLGLTGSKGDVGVSLSGGMIDLAKKAAAAAGILPPAKPDSVVRMQEKNEAESPSPTPSAADRQTSLLTIYYSGKDGGGSVEMWLDNDQIDTLLAQPANPKLTDLTRNNDTAHGLLQSMLDGPFGSFMNQHAGVRPDWSMEMAGRLALGNPSDPNASPMVMLQSLERPDLLAGTGGSDLLGGLIGLLRDAYAKSA